MSSSMKKRASQQESSALDPEAAAKNSQNYDSTNNSTNNLKKNRSDPAVVETTRTISANRLFYIYAVYGGLGFAIVINYIWGVVKLSSGDFGDEGASRLWGDIKSGSTLRYLNYASMLGAIIGYLLNFHYVVKFRESFSPNTFAATILFMGAFMLSSQAWIPYCINYLQALKDGASAAEKEHIFQMINWNLKISGMLAFSWACTQWFFGPSALTADSNLDKNSQAQRSMEEDGADDENERFVPEKFPGDEKVPINWVSVLGKFGAFLFVIQTSFQDAIIWPQHFQDQSGFAALVSGGK